MLEQFDEDFVVTHEVPPDLAFVEKLYFDLEKLKQFDPEFNYPGFTFNTGNVVATTGILHRTDFEPLVRFGNPPQLTHPEIFRCGEQGVLNYALMKKQAQGHISLRRHRFMELPDCSPGKDIEIDKLTADSPYPFLLHWCGLTRNVISPVFANTLRADLLLHFEKRYYDRLALGSLRRWTNLYVAQLDSNMRTAAKSIPGVAAARKLLK